MSFPTFVRYDKPNCFLACWPTATPGEGTRVPSHSANSSGYVNASTVAPNSSAEIRFRYLMLSAYCGLDAAPEGDSVTVVRPFQATPSLYTPVSYSRSPTLSHSRAVICFLSLRRILCKRHDSGCRL